MKDYYKILGVERTSTADDIKRAYRRLASQHHPDKGGDTNKFQEIEEAYRILSDPGTRQQYDDPRSAMFQDFGQGRPNFNFDDIFQMFGARINPRQQQRMATARLTLWISLRDAMVGGSRVIAVSSPHGQSNLEIDVPTGIDDGESVRYPGLAPGGVDLVINFRIRPEAGWVKHDQNILHDVSISIWDLILGGDLKVTTLTGQEISITVQPNTQPGTTLRCRGHGFKSRKQATAGDLLVKLHARIPSTVSPELLERIQQERGQ
jgi:DnaJ-class molecular chaperone